jgi:invasion protein IalB
VTPPATAAFACALLASAAAASERFVETVAGWTVACDGAVAGVRTCQLRNHEGGKPAAGQAALLSFDLRAGQNEAEGLVQVAALALPPRLEIELAFGSEIVNVEAVGLEGGLTASFAIPRDELPDLAGTEAAHLRFTDQKGQVYETLIPMTGFAEALGLAERAL